MTTSKPDSLLLEPAFRELLVAAKNSLSADIEWSATDSGSAAYNRLERAIASLERLQATEMTDHEQLVQAQQLFSNLMAELSRNPLLRKAKLHRIALEFINELDRMIEEAQ